MADPNVKVDQAVGGLESATAQSSNAGERGTSAGKPIAGDSGAGPDRSAPAKTHGAAELTGGKTGGLKDLTGGPSSSISDLTGSKEEDKSNSGSGNKGGLFSGITGSGKETGFSGLTGGKTGGVSDLTGQETGGIGDLVDRK
ncbi:hypothetical protein ABBQ32_004499 [Trebouxia sp. C0010 RCD-2024]